MKILSFLLVISALFANDDKNIITFISEDSIKIYAKSYIKYSDNRPFIILFHQAGWSHGEYNEIAPTLNELGYNCLAINQRSGGEVNNTINLTNKNAKELGKSTTYIDAYPDMRAALKFVQYNYKSEKIIVWGSSYSAALSLKLASEFDKEIHGVIAFSPGEYFSKFGKSKTYITQSAKNINVPAFITSAKNEKNYWQNIYESIPSKNKTFFLPETEGNHGSRALWQQFNDSIEYWNAIKKFLNQYFPV